MRPVILITFLIWQLQRVNCLEFAKRSQIDNPSLEFMSILRDNITVVIDKGLEDVYSVLMLKNSKAALEELKTRMFEFKETLLKHLELDLSSSAKEVVDQKTKQSIDNDIYAFRETVVLKWENTLSTDLENLQEKILPAWIVKFKYIWKGAERKVLEKVDKFKRFVQKTYPGSCWKKSKNLKSSNLLQKDFIMMENQSISLIGSKSNDLIIPLTAQFAAVFLAVLGFIILPFGAPLWLCLLMVVFGEFLNFLIGAYLSFNQHGLKIDPAFLPGLTIDPALQDQDLDSDHKDLPISNTD